jgi:hypothetical protein
MNIIIIPLSKAKLYINETKYDGYDSRDPYDYFYDDKLEELFIPDNFSDDKFKKYYYLPEITGRCCLNIIDILKKNYNLLLENGYKCDFDIKSANELDIFTLYTKKLLDICLKYPNDVIISDYNDSLKLTEDELNLKIEEIEKKNVKIPKIFFKHPKRGRIKIDNFKDCTEAYVIMATKKDKNTQRMYDLCWKMPDAPKN